MNTYHIKMTMHLLILNFFLKKFWRFSEKYKDNSVSKIDDSDQQEILTNFDVIFSKIENSEERIHSCCTTFLAVDVKELKSIVIVALHRAHIR